MHSSLSCHCPLFTPLVLFIYSSIRISEAQSLRSNLWKEDTECLKWLDSKEPNIVVYVNLGSITVMTTQQLVEFAWGLANSKNNFLWIIRPDLVVGEFASLPAEFTEETKERGLLASWCPQEDVLHHASIAVFLTQWLELSTRKLELWNSYDLLAVFYRPTNKLQVLI
ncbi:hypothetical protein MKX01_021149 [Papaver californicum]|nr:hypothetical protein MKX01_021149 [Papaver californicum]